MKSKSSYSTLRGDKLLFSLLRGEAGNAGALANDLLDEFSEGYPLGKLRRLLKSSNSEAVTAGIWIASEMGAESKPLMSDIVRLIEHPSHQVRFFVLECLITCAGCEDKHAVNKALSLLEDPHSGVRWETLVFLATAPEIVLRAAMDVATEYDHMGLRAKGLELILDSNVSGANEAILTSLNGADPILRKYAAASAARIAHRDIVPLQRAVELQDAEISQFAKDMLERQGSHS